MLGQESNLGFNHSKHSQYLNDEAESRGEFNDDVLQMMRNHQGNTGDVIEEYESVVQMNPNYEKWYRLGHLNPEDIYNHKWVIQF